MQMGVSTGTSTRWLFVHSLCGRHSKGKGKGENSGVQEQEQG